MKLLFHGHVLFIQVDDTVSKLSVLVLCLNKAEGLKYP